MMMIAMQNAATDSTTAALLELLVLQCKKYDIIIILYII